MTENDVHKCLISYGFYPMTLIIKELEQQDRFEECLIIHSAMLVYRKRFTIVEDDIPTRWSEEFEKEYFSMFKVVSDSGRLLIEDNLEYYLKDIKRRLDIK